MRYLAAVLILPFFFAIQLVLLALAAMLTVLVIPMLWLFDEQQEAAVFLLFGPIQVWVNEVWNTQS